MRVIWAPRAIARAAEIAQYIAADRPGRPKPGWSSGSPRLRRRQQHARRGRKVPDVHRDEVRQILHGKHRIIDRVDAKGVVVLTVRHSREQWDPTDVLARGPVARSRNAVR